MDVTDWVYLETDDSCATCGARGDHLLTVHHIDGDRSNTPMTTRSSCATTAMSRTTRKAGRWAPSTSHRSLSGSAI